MQLGADLDEPQVRFFESVTAAMPATARLILCVPFAQWLMQKAYPSDPDYDDHALKFLQDKVFKRPIKVFLSGDIHCYQRHEDSNGRQKIVAGGGGSFLHPTHAPDARHLPDGFYEKKAYPSHAQSRALNLRNLAFPLWNPRFGYAAALFYAITAWLVSATLTASDVVNFDVALEKASQAILTNPLTGIWMLAVIGAFVFFTDTHMRWYRILGGMSHALAHLAAAFALGWLALAATVHGAGLHFKTVPQLLLSGVIMLAGGWLSGGLIMGLYLYLSLAAFRRHANEAFSALRLQDFRNFLRFKIDSSGALNIYAIGIERVARHWSKADCNGAATLVPSSKDGRATAPHLIEALRVT
jgi:hypothetical protein